MSKLVNKLSAKKEYFLLKPSVLKLGTEPATKVVVLYSVSVSFLHNLTANS